MKESPCLFLPRNTYDPLTFHSDGICCSTSFLEMNGCVPEVVFISRKKESAVLGGRPGWMITDTFEGASWRIYRDIWQGEHAMACRYRICNLGRENRALDTVRIFSADKASMLDLAGVPAGQWNAYLDQDDAMDGIPSAVRVGCLDRDYVISRTGAVWKREEIDQMFSENPLTLKFKPYGVFGTDCPESARVLFGFLSLDSHLVEMDLTTDRSRSELRSFRSFGILNCEIAPGEERCLQTFVVMTGYAEPEKMAEEYIDWVGCYYGIPETPRKNALAVGCTWHYYGGAVTEKIVRENIEAVHKRHIPLDVFLIDDFWEECYGDWVARKDAFPSGMRAIASEIKRASLRPGIWTAPFAVKKTSELAAVHPEWMMRKKDGQLAEYFGSYVLDLTFPGVLGWVEQLFRRLHDDYGFEYYKIDFARCEFLAGGVCWNRSVTTLEAYRRGIEVIRKAVGPDSFICICGGHYGASIGLCDTQRNSGDTYGKWSFTLGNTSVPMEEFRVKQTLGRLPYRRLWQTNADGMIVRRQEKSVCKEDFGLSVGILSDSEAYLSSVLHYVNGGILMCGESLTQIDDERLALYRHVIPSINGISRAADLMRKWHSARIVTEIHPRCKDLDDWNTVSLLNLDEKEVQLDLTFSGIVTEHLAGDRFILFDNTAGEMLGIFKQDETVLLAPLAGHSARVLKVIPLKNTEEQVIFLGTDLHHSGGGVEIASWRSSHNTACGTLDTPWIQYPVRISAARIAEGNAEVRTVILEPGRRDFSLNF